MSGKRGSNPRPSAWEADALPLSYSRIIPILTNHLYEHLQSAWDPAIAGLPLSYSRIIPILTNHLYEHLQSAWDPATAGLPLSYSRNDANIIKIHPQVQVVL